MSNNVIQHKLSLLKEERAKLKKQKPFILWFTGLSGSGKSTIANALEVKIYQSRFHTYLLDGDNVRQGLNKDLGFDKSSRVENIRRIGEVAKLFLDSGTIIIAASISPFIADRQLVRDLVQKNEFIEIFVDTPLAICENRDIKGLYKKARSGHIANFTGLSSPYEKPNNPEIHLTNYHDIQTNVDLIMEYLTKNKYLNVK